MMKFLAFLVVFYGFLVSAQEKIESSISERFNLVESLKDVLREDGIPPWDRNKILLIYKKEQLIAYWKVI